MHKYETHKLTTKEALISLHSIHDYDYRHAKVTLSNRFQVLTFVMLIAEAGGLGRRQQTKFLLVDQDQREEWETQVHLQGREMVQKTEQRL